MADDWKFTHELADLTPEVWDFLKENRFFGMIIPKEYGGLGFSARAHSAVLQKLTSTSITLSSNVAVPNSLGPAELILHYGTDEQKNHYLPRLARGAEVPCFGLTGPTAGSDATSIPDVGIVCKRKYDGKQVLGNQPDLRQAIYHPGPGGHGGWPGIPAQGSGGTDRRGGRPRH